MSGYSLPPSQAVLIERLTAAQSRLAALNETRSTGIRRVKHGEKETEFRPDADLAAAVLALEREIADLLLLLSGAVPRRMARSVVIVAGKGL